MIAPVDKAWAQLSRPAFPNHDAGSSAPREAGILIAGDHENWRELDKSLARPHKHAAQASISRAQQEDFVPKAGVVRAWPTVIR